MRRDIYQTPDESGGGAWVPDTQSVSVSAQMREGVDIKGSRASERQSSADPAENRGKGHLGKEGDKEHSKKREREYRSAGMHLTSTGTKYTATKKLRS